MVGARERRLRVLHRSELLGVLLANSDPIAVAGTHGKTTTTGMIGVCLVEAELDPTVIVGGNVRDLGGHFRVGEGDPLVFEACESDGTFLNYRDCSQVITSLEPDHLDQHQTFNNLRDSFRRFIESGRRDGFLVFCGDDAELGALVDHAPGSALAYGLGENADFRLTDLQSGLGSCSFDVRTPDGTRHRVDLSVPGPHNALNAAAAFAAATQVGAPAEAVAEALGSFSGVARRFDILWRGSGLLVVDDYAHHPTEIAATLKAARQSWDGRIIAVFQPHLYSRTKYLLDGFARAFGDADEIIITEIYAAREDPTPDVSGEMLAGAVAEAEAGKPVSFVKAKEQIVTGLLPRLAPGDMVIGIGAGDVREVGERLAEALKASAGDHRP
jgi:UDP-N-acetylmuramate--alanine ligase